VILIALVLELRSGRLGQRGGDDRRVVSRDQRRLARAQLMKERGEVGGEDFVDIEALDVDERDARLLPTFR
jgi:hypothetical protein